MSERDSLNNIRAIKDKYLSFLGGHKSRLDKLKVNSYREAANLVSYVGGAIYMLKEKGSDDKSMDYEMFLLNSLMTVYDRFKHFDFDKRQEDLALKRLDSTSKELCFTILNNDIETLEQMLNFKMLDEVLKSLMIAEPSLDAIYLYTEGDF